MSKSKLRQENMDGRSSKMGFTTFVTNQNSIKIKVHFWPKTKMKKRIAQHFKPKTKNAFQLKHMIIACLKKCQK